MAIFDGAIFDSNIFDTGEPVARVIFETGYDHRTTQRGQPGYQKAGSLSGRYK